MQGPLRVRRARRDDFARVQALLGSSGAPTRAERKRFRRLVTTMREDLYLAERGADGALAGLAVIAYLRGLGPQTALVRSLHGDGEARALLLECARARAVARGCTRLEVHLDPGDPPLETPWSDGPRAYHRATPAVEREVP
jgi:hypothetical protein